VHETENGVGDGVVHDECIEYGMEQEIRGVAVGVDNSSKDVVEYGAGGSSF
jgi:hypothetical protein